MLVFGLRPTKKHGVTTSSPVGVPPSQQDNLSLWFHYSLSRFEGETAVRPSAHVPVNIRSWIVEIARENPGTGAIIPITTGQGQT